MKTETVATIKRRGKHNSSLWTRIVKYRYIYLLVLPGFVYFLIFKYVPLWGLVLAFQEYSPYQGVFGSPWVGFDHFANLFGNSYFYTMLRNTLVINMMLLIFFFFLSLFY